MLTQRQGTFVHTRCVPWAAHVPSWGFYLLLFKMRQAFNNPQGKEGLSPHRWAQYGEKEAQA